MTYIANKTPAGLDAVTTALAGADLYPVQLFGESQVRAATHTQLMTAILALLGDADGALAANSDLKFATQRALRAYVDGRVAGLSWKQSARLASTANIILASALINGAVIDGVAAATGDRVLLKNQTAPAENGIYLVAASGAASRAPDADLAAELLQASLYVQEGTVAADKQFVMTTNGPITLGTTPLTFALLSTGGAGLPVGGSVGQMLVKNSGTDYDASWASVSGGGGGGNYLFKTDFEFPDTTTNFADSGSTAQTWTAPGYGRQISTTAPLSGLASLDMSGGFASIPWPASGAELGASDFAIKFRCKLVAGYNGYDCEICSAADEAGIPNAFKFYFGSAYTATFNAKVYTAAGVVTLTTADNALNGGVVFLVELIRGGSALTLKLNGTTAASGSIFGAVNARGGGHIALNGRYGGGFASQGKYDDFSILTAAPAGFVASSPLTTKGDLFAYSTVDGRVPVGTDGQVLTADSAQTFGLKWAAATGGSPTGWTSAISSTGTNNTVYVSSFTAVAGSANVDIAFISKGTGSLLACLPDGTTTGGLKRGANAVDLQGAGQRTASSNVAVGNNTVICGGYANGVANQNYGAIVGGTANYVNGIGSFVGGGSTNQVTFNGNYNAILGGDTNTISGGSRSAIGGGQTNSIGGTSGTIAGGLSNSIGAFNYASHMGGRSNVASADYATTLGGWNNTADGLYGSAHGRDSKTRGITNYHVVGNNQRAAQGDLQRGDINLGGNTTDATPTVLASDRTNASSTSTQIQCPTNGAVKIRGQVVGLQRGTTNCSTWSISAAMSNNGSTTVLVGSTVTLEHSSGTAMGTPTLTAGASGLVLTVTGIAATTLVWGAEMRAIEIA